MPDLSELEKTLFETADPGVCFATKQELIRLAREANERATEVVVRYVRTGRFDHIREFATSDLADLLSDPDPTMAAFFKEGLLDKVRGYWSILGYVRAAGREGYRELIQVAHDRRQPLENRAHAVKCLAVHSGQRFDRRAPSDPGFWKERHLRLDELDSWAGQGFPMGPGHAKPPRDPALDAPQTAFERVVARLDQKLADLRRTSQDHANPSDWLTPASVRDIKRIRRRWKLPERYLDFLTRFSPLRVYLFGKPFVNFLQLFGAHELIQGQVGYSHTRFLKRRIARWPANMVVIGHDGGDPYTLDLSHSTGEDAPIFTAMHGTGTWNFEPVAPSFEAFLDQLALR